MIAAKKKIEDDEEETTQKRPAGNEEEGSEQPQSQGKGPFALIAKAKNWAVENQTKALMIVGIAAGIILLTTSLIVWRIVTLRNRPTVEQAEMALEYGAYIQARNSAESVLRYAGKEEKEKRAAALYVQGGAAYELTSQSDITDKQSDFLAAANYLQESYALGFPDRIKTKGLLLLGKLLYMTDNIPKAVEILTEAEDAPNQDKKTVYRILADALCKTETPDYNLALHYCDLYSNHISTTAFEKEEARLLQAHVLLRLGRIDEANCVFESVPNRKEFEAFQEYIGAQLLMEEGRTFKTRVQTLEKQLLLSDSPFEIHAPNTVKSHEPAGQSSDQSTEQSTGKSGLSNPEESSDNQQIISDITTEPETTEEKKNDEKKNGTEMFNPFPNVTPAPNNNAPIPSNPTSPVPKPTAPEPSAPTPPIPGSPPQVQDTTTQAVPLFVSDVNSLPQTSSFVRQAVLNHRDTAQSPRKLKKIQSAIRQAQYVPTIQENTTAAAATSPSGPGQETSLEPGQEPGIALEQEPVQLPSQESEGDAPTLENVQKLRKATLDKYKEAILRLEMVKMADVDRFDYSRQASLLQGLCYSEIGEFPQAQDMYKFVINTFPNSNEAVAAEFLWAEIERLYGRFDSAIAGYARCVELMSKRPVYVNPFLPKKEIQLRVENAITNLLDREDFEDAFQMVAIFNKTIPKMTTARIGALGYERWAKNLRRRASAAKLSEWTSLQEQAREKFRQAGNWYRELAGLEYTSPNFNEYVWLSAENYRAGKNYVKAIPMYKEYLKHEGVRRQAETIAILGQLYFDLDKLDEAIAMFDEFLEFNSSHPLVYHVRLIKSYAHIEKKETTKAEVLLLENLSGVLAPQAPEYRDSLYALGKMYYNSGSREKAIEMLENATYLHPDAIQAPEAFYMIAQSYLFRVAQSQKKMQTTNLTTAKEQASLETQKARQAALNNFVKARDLLNNRQNVIALAKSEQMMLMISYFEVAKLELSLGRMKEALDSFNAAQNRYQNQPETLDALIQAAMIYRQLGQNENANEVINRGKILLQKLSATKAFPPGYRFNEQEWNELLNWQSKL